LKTKKPALSSLALLACLVATMSTSTLAQTWKWIDASGRITMSDRPPTLDIPAKSIISQPSVAERKAVAKPTPAAPSASADTGKEADGAAELSPQAKAAEARAKKEAAQAKEEVAAKKKADEERHAAVQKENCARARANSVALESGQRMSRPNEKGEFIVLDDGMRASELRRSREAIESNCKG
jgi:cytoskeletal protein RodZ